MRDIFTEIFDSQPLDPVEAARRSVRPRLRKRFYECASAGEGGALLLDRRAVRTPAQRSLAAPNAALAQALADEWNAQQDVIDPARMPLTRLANAVIDAVADAPAPVAEEVANYLGSDLVCYRAETPDGLVARQAQAWDPVLEWAHEKFGARFITIAGVTFVAQPAEVVAALRAQIPRDPWRLGAVSAMTTLTGSALLSLRVAQDAMSADDAWRAAHVDEDWQMEQWGRDAIALARRDFRFTEMRAAATVLRVVR